jgi:hypothetical protein
VKLTNEQKEHVKAARRADMRIQETWSLFCMHLSHEKRPEEALDLARQAVAVWAEWMDSEQIEFPEIEPGPNANESLEAVSQAAQEMFKKLAEQKAVATEYKYGVDVPDQAIDAALDPSADFFVNATEPFKEGFRAGIKYVCGLDRPVDAEFVASTEPSPEITAPTSESAITETGSQTKES